MGGRIWAQSEPDRGSTFSFTAPLRRQRQPQPAAEPSSVDLSGLRVLIVDDNPTNRRVMLKALRAWGLEPHEAADGGAALTALREAAEAGQAFQLVLLDDLLPDMDGLSVAGAIRADRGLSGTRIILLTSLGVRGDAARCRQLGLAGYLSKPLKQSQLLDAIMLVMGARSDAAAPQLVTQHTVAEHRRPRLRVLLAEDNAVSRLVATRILENGGHRVVAVENGREALAALERDDYDLVLMDVQMPEMDGFEATQAVRAREGGTRHTPVVGLTAHAMKGDRERCLEAGMDDYLSKPVKPDDLLAMLQRLTAARAAPRWAGRDTSAPLWRTASVNADRLMAACRGDEAMAREVVGVFLEWAPAHLDALGQALSTADSEAAAREAHALRGAAANVGADGLVTGLADLEQLALDGCWDEARERLAQLTAEFEALRSAVSSADT
jgi:CheY-like chemotaxis protein/HPt (histidine-containing phosphotransfer) domain-containing protein